MPNLRANRSVSSHTQILSGRRGSGERLRLNTEPELCGPAMEAAAHDPATRVYAERLVTEAAALAGAEAGTR
jgi:hypothetical protein